MSINSIKRREAKPFCEDSEVEAAFDGIVVDTLFGSLVADGGEAVGLDPPSTEKRAL